MGIRESVCEKTMVHAAKSGGEQPRVIIFSESGPLAGDLGACLSGRFAVERVTSLSAAYSALDTPADALLVVPGRSDRVGAECIPLFQRAADCSCRVLLLGGIHFELDEVLKKKIVELPPFPSPVLLFDRLSGLPLARKTEEG